MIAGVKTENVSCDPNHALLTVICHLYMLGLDIAYLCTKLNDCSCSRSRDMVGYHHNVNGSRDLTTPLSGTVCLLGLALATINPHAKFEISMTTQYEDIKGDRKCGNGVV